MKLIDKCIVTDQSDIAQLLACHANSAGLVSVKAFPLANSNKDWSTGIFDLYAFKRCAYAGIKNFSIDESFTTQTYLSNVISFEFMLQGGSDRRLGNKVFSNNDMPKLYVTSHGQTSEQTRFHKAGEKYVGVGIWIPPESLRDLFNFECDDYPRAVSDLLTARQNRTLTFPVTGALRAIVEQILANPFTHKLSFNYLDAKFTELLCHTLLCIQSSEYAYNKCPSGNPHIQFIN